MESDYAFIKLAKNTDIDPPALAVNLKNFQKDMMSFSYLNLN